MELHSYAKRRTTKKWTIEQKRKLVEARISHDAIFINEPRNSVLPWKKILALAKLDDFNVFFVRKQWSNMVAKYKQYKQNRLGNIPTKAIDNEMIQKITQEWEYFQPIHHFMTRKTTNLHSYALTRSAEPQARTDTQHDYAKQLSPEQQDNQASTSSIERANMFSSDTNDDFTTGALEEFQQVETDREFYWHHQDDDLEEEDATMDGNSNDDIGGGGGGRRDNNVGGGNPALSYFADASEDTQESLIIEPIIMLNVQETEQLGEESIVNTLLAYANSISTTTTITTTTATSAITSTKQQQQDSKNDLSLLEKKKNTTDCSDGVGGGGGSGSRTNVQTKCVQLENTVGQQQHQQQQVPKRIMPKRITHLSEREKYYRHKRRFNRRLERRFDSLLNVFGQIVRAEYPSIDVNPLLGVATSTSAVINTLFSSDDEYEPANAAGLGDGSSCDDNNEEEDDVKIRPATIAAAAVVAAATADKQQSRPQQNGH